MSQAYEVNFDGLVGPTHNYAGLSKGNIASSIHAAQVSSPKRAALQGLEKMKFLADLGIKQAVLPPHNRPNTTLLKRLGFSGNTDSDVVITAAKQAPMLLAQLSSASSMWVANAATISPFSDTLDGKTHITPANLSTMFHRSTEFEQTGRTLQAIFQGSDYVHHQALPLGAQFSDEGAANHTRFCNEYNQAGIEFFVYGSGAAEAPSEKFPSRQTLSACDAINRMHGLKQGTYVSAQQNPAAIDAGVFHNDVISVGNRDVLFYHEQAFLNTDQVKADLQNAFAQHCGGQMQFVEVPASKVSLEQAVQTYLFNGQLLSIPNQAGATLLVPHEVKNNPAVFDYLSALTDSSQQIQKVHYLDLKESMKNGGGPACLRLRVVMNEEQIANTKARVFLTDSLYNDLKTWINEHYRSQLKASDMLDPQLMDESRKALDELTHILKIGSIYDFQG